MSDSKPRPQRRRPRHRTIVAMLAPAAAALSVAACSPDPLGIPLGAQAHETSAADEAQARATCAGCHAFPPPDILPRGAWRDEFVRMHFIREKRLPPVGPPAAVNRGVQLPPDMEQALRFYTARAPERLPPPEPWPAPAESPLTFRHHTLSVAEMPANPAVSHVRLIDLDGDGRPELLGTDMRQGVVFRGRPAEAGSVLAVIASIPHPAHVEPVDVDQDGRTDLLVAELGEFFPADHDKGAVIWLRALATGKFGAYWLDGWPRVADVAAADFNGDGRNDLAVAAFGWRTTGRIAILENRTTDPARPDFAPHVIDPRPGGIHAIPVDFNKDGKMDVVALLAQEHETVVAYINRGAGDFSFEPRVIYAAPHPNWGSSGIQLVDLDADGDLDVLLTHGDTFDDGLVKPYHGIQWLENTGGFPFVERTLAPMPGVHRALAADLDGDGDLDIVAGALLAGGSDVDEATLPALAWLEQTSRGTFVRHTIAIGSPRHASIDVADIDGDGDPDIVAGQFSIDKPSAGWVDVWVNERKKTGRPELPGPGSGERGRR
ncbi:MAG TPA: VCBS repeat-containing protein [Vicinamibacterales bacterium]|nr:VCBS repeat-containing protein [Vicinamibacterales bacterium]